MEQIIERNNLQEKSFELGLLKLKKALDDKDSVLASSIIQDLEHQINDIEAGEIRLSFYFLKTRFLLKEEDTKTAINTLDRIESLLKKYPDALSKAEYLFLKAWALCKTSPDKAEQFFKEASLIYKSAGATTRLKDLRTYRDKLCKS